MAAPINKRSTPRTTPSWTRFSQAGRIWLLAILALSVSACGMRPTAVRMPPPTPPALEQPQPQLDPSLLAPCPDLPLATSGKLPALQRNHAQVTDLYHDCQKRHAHLANAVKTQQAQAAARLQRAREASGTAAQH